MSKLTQTFNNLRDKIFTNVHSNNLIYNTCWEDPRCDRQMLNFGEDSQIVMITSAGCNALDYLLDEPKSIDCIDMNSRQNALLQLKIAGLQHLEYADFWKIFGEGKHPEAVSLYAKYLRPNITAEAQEFWDKNILHFTKKSFYFFGTSGTFAWIFYQYINARPKLRRLIQDLLEAKDIPTQQAIYKEVEPKIINQVVKWLINRHLTLTLLGVPRAQRQLIVDEYPGKVAGFASDCLRHVFTQLPIHENYFWRLYLTGKYTPECCPEYLKEENFLKLRKLSSRIQTHTTTVSNFLRQQPNKYSHFILLDHQDWLAAHDVEALIDEWNLVLKNSKSGSKILLRSAALKVDFFPDFVEKALDFQVDAVEKTHKIDRVGTYGSTYFGIVK